MHPKAHVLTSTILGTVLVSGLAAAQTAPATNEHCPCPAPLTAAQRARAHERAVKAREAREARQRAEDERAQQLTDTQQRLADAQRQLDSERANGDARWRTEHDRASNLEAENRRLHDNEAAWREREARLLSERTAQRSRGGGPTRVHRWMVGAEGGVGTFTEEFKFGEGTGAATYTGPAWGVRGGVAVLPWLAFEGRYLGFYNPGVATATGGAGLVTNAGLATVHLIAPLPFVQPYVFAGVGVYDTRVAGNRTDRQATNLTDNTSFGIPVGVGLNVPITNIVSIGAEGTFHYLRNESFSTREEFAGGDPVTFSSVLRIHL